MNATDYRIEDVHQVTYNGRQYKVFKAYRKETGAFVFCGEFTAPHRTAKRDLWMFADKTETA